MNTKKKVTSNFIVGVTGQFITICLGIVLPRLLLTSFGSEINGLLSTVAQVYTYIALLEAGIGTASRNALYKCFAEQDRVGVANTLNATKRYFRRVSVAYFCCIIGAVIIFPFVLDTDIPWEIIAAVVLLQGLSGLINFVCVSAYEQLLHADGKSYICNLVNLLVSIVSYATRIVLIALGCNVVIVQTAFLLVSLLKAAVLYAYYRKKYPEICYDRKADLSCLSQRNAFVVHEISGAINHGSALVIISVFCDLKQASIYTVYSLIYNNLRNLMNKVCESVDFYLGQTYHRSIEAYKKLHDFVETCYMAIGFAVFTSAYCVTIPFVQLYTSGVEDAEYVNFLLPVLFVIIELLVVIRQISSKLIHISGNAANTRINTIMEASITLVCSLILVQFIGLYGVLLGLIISSLYRTNDIIIYVNKKVLNRSCKKTYISAIVNFAITVIFAILSNKIGVEISSYFEFAVFGFLTFVCVSAVFLLTTVIVRYDLIKELMRMRKSTNTQ